MIWIVIGVLLLIAVLVLTGYVSDTGSDKSIGYFGIGIFTTLLGISGICSISLVIDDDIPTAIDVYRGKTTLEITYRDSVSIDSTVVYKEYLEEKK